MSYITASQYSSITGRYQAEATDARIKRASLLLDARIGNYPTTSDGWKLDIAMLSTKQLAAVEEWVAQMVTFLYDNGDFSPSSASITLGRFSVTEHGQQTKSIPEQVSFADTILVSAGLVRSGVRLR